MKMETAAQNRAGCVEEWPVAYSTPGATRLKSRKSRLEYF